MEANFEYRRRNTVGVLKLRGVLDIFEASALHSEAKTALSDAGADSFEIDYSEVERMDLTSYQVLRAFRKGCEGIGKEVIASPIPANLAPLESLGLAL